MVHQQAAEVRLSINDHDLDAHCALLPAGGTLHADNRIRVITVNPIEFGQAIEFCLTPLLLTVVSAQFEFRQVLVRHVPCHILAGESGSIKLGNGRIVMPN
jgi:hypothetical protein